MTSRPDPHPTPRSTPRSPLGLMAPFLVLALALVACEAPQPDPALEAHPATQPDPLSLADRLAQARIVDLTHPFSEETLVWPTSRAFEFEVTFEGITDGGYYYASRDFAGPEHGGTHLDAPIHFAEGMWTTEQIPVERLIGPGVVVDVSHQAGEDPNYEITAADLMAWEETHGRIPDDAFLLLFTDRSRLWPDAEAYMGTARRGEDAVAELAFPGLHPDAARWLVENRAIAAVGIDTPSIDNGPSVEFESHRILMAENIFALENVARLEELPATGATILALPMLLEGGTGGPIRIVALVE
jgi:kynurenine formamidase